MNVQRNVLVVGEDAVLTGEIKSPGRVEIYGRLEGDVVSEDVIVHKDAELKGSVRAKAAKVSGAMSGDVRIKELISIDSTGVVNGKVLYGRLAMEEGAELAATLRNVPPTLGGDLNLAVRRGRSVRLTPDDLKAEDKDDAPDRLTFNVASASGGFLARTNAPTKPVAKFTQADIDTGSILFAHDGSAGERASFSVTVSDAAGATAGAAKTVAVAVHG
jgi:cytoskeletal protein CcmA (bactofilin family)